MSDYQPGVCNIGREERQKRRAAGAMGFLAAAGYVAFVLASGWSDTALLGTFPLLFGGFVGLVQDRMGFCVAFGALARYDLSGSGGEEGRVENADAVRHDRLKALQILAVSGAAAAVATVAVYAVGTAV
jgi:hypothetical protein